MNRFLCVQNSSVFDNSTISKFPRKLSVISVFVLPILALIGNSLILLVMESNTQFNRSSFSIYIKSMAISDTLVLLFKFFSYLNKESKYYFPSMCTIILFCYEASKLLSVWIIVTITIERTLVVLFPLHKIKFVSVSRARFTVIIIGTLAVLFAARLLIIPIDTSVNQRRRCHPSSAKWINYRSTNMFIMEFGYCYIPLAIVIIGNLLTVCTVRRAVIRRHDMLINSSYIQKRQSDANENQLLLMLLAVTVMFIVYFVPFTVTSVISRRGLPFHQCFTVKSIKIYFLLRSISDFLKDLNFCTNFIIYCVSGRRFRHALAVLFRKLTRQSSINSQNYDAVRNRSGYFLKKFTAPKIVHVSARDTVEETQF